MRPGVDIFTSITLQMMKVSRCNICVSKFDPPSYQILLHIQAYQSVI